MASGYLRYLFNREPQKMLLSSVALVGTMGYFLKVGAHRVSDRAHAIATESALRAADERMAAAEKGVEEHYASARRAEEMVKLGTSLLDKGLEDKVKMSKDGPSQLKRLEREVEMARLAVKEAREKAAAPAH